MRVRGEVFSGALRGTPLIEKYYPRLIGLIGFRPFKGTMDVKLERNIDIRPFSSKTMDHILTDGSKIVNAHLAPVKIRKLSTVYKLMEIRTREEEIVRDARKMQDAAEERFSIKRDEDIDEVFHNCWAVQFKNGIYGNDIVELISDVMLKKHLSVDDGDNIEIEFAKEKDEKDKFFIPKGDTNPPPE